MFPERLDDRTFRLFVQRTCSLIKNKAELSKTEQDLADLLLAYPELGFLLRKQEVDIQVHYSDDDFNPFLVLAGLWEVKKQLEQNTPRGYRRIVYEKFGTESPDSQQLFTLAEVYLTVYSRVKDNGGLIDAKDYLYDVQYILNNQEEINNLDVEVNYPESYSEHNGDQISQGMYNELFSNFVHTMYEEQSSKTIALDSSLNSMLNLLPSTWIDAVCREWKLPKTGLKREQIAGIVAFLSSPDSMAEIRSALSQNELELLAALLKQNGFMDYDELTHKYGSEQNDSYWWETKPPHSTLGRLRLKGLVVVGKATVEHRQRKIVLVAQEIRASVEKIVQA